MKYSVIAQLTTDEIREKIDLEVTALNQMKMNHRISQLENPIQIRDKRKAVARLHTELRKREFNGESK